MPKLSSGKSFCAKLSSAKISSPVGNWRVDACPKGLHLVKLAPEVNNDNFLELGSENVDLVDDHLPNEKVECFDEIHIWMRIYFSTDSTLQKQKQLPKGKYRMLRTLIVHAFWSEVS